MERKDEIRLLTALFLTNLAAPDLAQNATGAEITAALTGNTAQGNMDASSADTEHYAEHGTAFGPDYKARWSVEGDQRFWIHEGAEEDCRDVGISGDQVPWI